MHMGKSMVPEKCFPYRIVRDANQLSRCHLLVSKYGVFLKTIYFILDNSFRNKVRECSCPWLRQSLVYTLGNFLCVYLVSSIWLKYKKTLYNSTVFIASTVNPISYCLDDFPSNLTTLLVTTCFLQIYNWENVLWRLNH